MKARSKSAHEKANRLLHEKGTATITLRFPASMGKTILHGWGDYPSERTKHFRSRHLQDAYMRVQFINGDLPRMVELARGFGSLAHMACGASFPKAKTEFLRKIAGHCMGWAKTLQPQHDVFDLVNKERGDQRDQFISGKHGFDISNPRGDEALKLLVLTEEVGEVADAIQSLMKREVMVAVENSTRARVASADAVQHLCDELIQVAAVCIAWLEAITAKGGAR